MLTAEQIIAAQKSQIDTLFGLTQKAFEGVEKLVELERLADTEPRLRRGSHFRNWALLKSILRDQYAHLPAQAWVNWTFA